VYQRHRPFLVVESREVLQLQVFPCERVYYPTFLQVLKGLWHFGYLTICRRFSPPALSPVRFATVRLAREIVQPGKMFEPGKEKLLCQLVYPTVVGLSGDLMYEQEVAHLQKTRRVMKDRPSQHQ